MSNFSNPASTPGNPKADAGLIYIGSLDDDSLTVQAQYNPKEIQVDKNVGWQKKNQANQANPTGLQLEFTGAEGRSMSVELFFDGYETKKSVGPQIAMLNKMASVIKPTSTKESERRPHLCMAVWGSTVQSFKCVIQSVSVKYSMFSENGDPLRATCTVKLMEADVVTNAQDSSAGATPPASR
jgi:hypothetical protein